MDPLTLTRARQAAVLSAFHHNAEIVVPNALLPAPYRMPSVKTAPKLLGLHQEEARMHRAAVQAAARGVMAASRTASRATHAYRLRNLALLAPDAHDRFHQAYGAVGPTPALQAAARENDLPEAELQPKNADRKLAMIPGGSLWSRNTVPQGPYLELLARQIGVPFDQFPVLLHTHDAWPDLDSFVTTVVIWLTIDRARLPDIQWLEHFGFNMNPANWATVAKEYFGASTVEKVIESKEDGNLSHWSGFLSEQVDSSLNGSFTSRIHNRLGIDYTLDRAKEELHVHYRLDEAISSEIGGFTEDGGLDVDRGGVVMWSDEARRFFYVVATKELRFVNREAPVLPGGVNAGEFLNFMAPASVGLWMDALVFQTALDAIKAAVHGARGNPNEGHKHG